MVGRRGRGRLGWFGLLGLVVAFILVPQFVSLFAFGVTAIEEGYATVRGAVASELVPDLGGALIAVVVILRLGWTREVLVEHRRLRPWVWVVPVSLVAVSLVAVDWQRFGSVGPLLATTLVLATFATGLSEELLFRGVALVAMRDRYGELAAGILSSLLFGATHLVNALVLGGGAVPQALLAASMGWLLYLSRRVSGGILVPVVVHWLYDLSVFSAEVGPGEREPLSDAGLALLLLQVVLFVVVVVAHRATAPRHATA